MGVNRVYSPAEVCEMFDISKSTLFRWEQKHWFPAVARDLSNQRQYTSEHIRAITEEQKAKLSKQLERVFEAGDVTAYREVLRAVSMYKFLEGDRTGLCELSQYPTLPPGLVRQLLEMATKEYELGDPHLNDVLEIVLDQSRKMSRTEEASTEVGNDRAFSRL